MIRAWRLSRTNFRPVWFGSGRSVSTRPKLDHVLVQVAQIEEYAAEPLKIEGDYSEAWHCSACQASGHTIPGELLPDMCPTCGGEDSVSPGYISSRKGKPLKNICPQCRFPSTERYIAEHGKCGACMKPPRKDGKRRMACTHGCRVPPCGDLLPVGEWAFNGHGVAVTPI